MSKNTEYLETIMDINFDSIPFLEFCERNITDKILDRCHIEVVPESLNSLIQEFLIEQYTLNKNGVGEGKKEVSSASDINQKVDFNTVGGANSMSKSAEEFLDRNMSTLIKYRKMLR